MGSTARILLHLAAALAGWGIVRSQHPELSGAEQPVPSGKSSIRETRDREAGDKLLRRLVPDLAPAAPAEVVRHEGTLEERAIHAFLNDTFPANPGTPGDHVSVDYLRDEIRETVTGGRGPDLSYAFFHGRMEAPQVLEALRKIFPDLAQENQFPKAVFLELLPVDPVRAVVLLDGLSPEERSSWLAESRLHLTGIDGPELALAILNVESAIASGTGVDFLRNHVDFYSRQFHVSMGNDYNDWLLAQPPSRGRELMLKNLVSHLDSEDPAAAVALKKRISTR